jgi:hypothetical protein
MASIAERLISCKLARVTARQTVGRAGADIVSDRWGASIRLAKAAHSRLPLSRAVPMALGYIEEIIMFRRSKLMLGIRKSWLSTFLQPCDIQNTDTGT